MSTAAPRPCGQHRQLRWPLRIGRRQQDLLVWPENSHYQVMVRQECIPQRRGQAFELCQGIHLRNEVLGMLQLTREFSTVQILEVAFDRPPDQPAQSQQHGDRTQGEQQREPRRQRKTCDHGASST